MILRRTLSALIVFVTACGISIEASEPLAFVAQLEGTWTLETDANTEFRVTIPGGQPLYATQFDFAVDIVSPSGTTTYDGTADERSITLRDPGSGALVLAGAISQNEFLRLTDGRVFTKPFEPSLPGIWEDVNVPGRRYVVEIQQASEGLNEGNASGCARPASNRVASTEEVEGALTINYRGDVIDLWRVEEGSGILAVRAPGYFVGHSAIRVKRIEGFIHLQRVDRVEACP